jgi:hypothetical protein
MSYNGGPCGYSGGYGYSGPAYAPNQLAAIQQRAVVDNFRAGTRVFAHRILTGVAIWSQMSASNYMYLEMRKTSEPTARYSCYSRSRVKLFAIYGVCYSPFAATGATPTAVDTATTGRVSSHITSRAQRITTNDAYWEGIVPVGPTGEIWVAYTKRTNATYARVDIDGSTDAANELPTNGTYRYIDTYGAVDNTRAQFVKVASGLSVGNHTVRITKKADKHASSGGSTGVTIEAVCVPCHPGDTNWQPPAFPLSTAVVRGDEFRGANGYFYCCTVAGTTHASTEPTHTSSTATNGTATFQAFTTSTWHQYAVEEAYPSELELAATVTKNATSEDFGGQTHGGSPGTDSVSSTTWTIDGASVDVGAYSMWQVSSAASEITLTESIDWVHSQAADLATQSMVRTFRPGFMRVSGQTEWNAIADVGWYYSAMLPLVRYDGERQVNAINTVTPSVGSAVTLQDYVSDAGNPNVDFGSIYGVRTDGTTWLHKGSGENTATHVYIEPYSVDEYAAANASCFLRPNVNGAAGSGSTDWQVKLYFERAHDGGSEVTVAIGDVWRQWSEYRFVMT